MLAGPKPIHRTGGSATACVHARVSSPIAHATGPVDDPPPDARASRRLIRFFEGAAFADNLKWNSCTCQFLYVDHSKVDWNALTSEQKRASACERIACHRSKACWLTAKARSWGGAMPLRERCSIPSSTSPTPMPVRWARSPASSWPREHQRTGVARALLDAACDQLREQGLDIAEAHPSPRAASDAENHFGPLSLYLSAGSTVVRERDDGLTVVRRSLL
jgi:hypothetical protein